MQLYMNPRIAMIANEMQCDYSVAGWFMAVIESLDNDGILDALTDEMFWTMCSKKSRLTRDRIVGMYRDMKRDIQRDKERDRKRDYRARKSAVLSEEISPETSQNEGDLEGVIDNPNNLSPANNTIPREEKQDINNINISIAQTKPNRRRPRTTNPEGFDRFWAVYPRRVNKREAMKAWAKINPDEATVDRIVAHIKRLLETEWTVAQRERKFIPYPTTYLNRRSWEDDPEEENNRENDHSSRLTDEEFFAGWSEEQIAEVERLANDGRHYG